MKKYIAKIVTAVALFWLVIAQNWAAENKVTVFAAVSLTNALNDIVTQYEKDHNTKIIALYASSSTLARQIEQDAPTDIFISADQQWMDYVQQKQLMVNASRHTLLGNNLVLIAPINSALKPITISKKTDWRTLANGERIAVGDPDHVPVGIYAKQALVSLGAWKTVDTMLARTNNVRSGMALVELNEASLGIVYGSDVGVSKKVKVVGIFPENSYNAIEYPMAIVKNHQTNQVNDFFAYLKTPAAAAIFKHYGFSPL
ncbi:molybdate ABC transporter substrate-binding protein [Candidatus Arsenophonus triatominarum]|uniref:molybdate ABC transporter substrate-binding protein n=1 Tax=Candidatus Arsenophonus triatominarum TaxID=57911 RepID=UPI0007C501D0|nr:molybdate ABC transporter substrate-binding protein [Candidatus Arsenophonus triatominarum]